jgi:hypothetical protein
MSKASSMTLPSPHNSRVGDTSRTVKKLQSNTSISGGAADEKPRVIIGRESLLHYEPNKPMLGGSFTQRGKKGSS